MKRFWKDNSRLFSKMIVYQLAMIILGATTAFATSSTPVWFCLSSAFAVLFYLFLLAMAAYLEGREDGIRIEAGKIKPRPWRVLAVSAMANAPAIACGLALLICDAAGAQSAAEVFKLIDAAVLHIMYRGLAKTLTSDSNLIIALMPLPAIVASSVFYLLGIRFKDGFIKKNEPGEGTRRYKGLK